MSQGQEETCRILHLLKVLGSSLKEGVIEKDPEGRPSKENKDLSDSGREKKRLAKNCQELHGQNYQATLRPISG